MAKTDVRNSVYTDLDSLFDTRAIMIEALTNKGKFDINLTPNKYLKRVKDNFGTMSNKIFYYYYSKRNSSVLKYPLITSVPDYIKDYYADVLDNNKESLDLTLYVNFYPYKLNASETSKLMAILVNVFTSVNIKIINVPIKEIDINWVTEHVGMLIFYDALKWIRNVTDLANGIDYRMVNTMIIAPFIIDGVLPTKKLDSKTTDGLIKFFRLTSDFYFLDSNTFSLKQ